MGQGENRTVLPRSNFFDDRTLDRVSYRREDSGWIARRLEEASTLIVPVWSSRCLVVPDDPPFAVLLPLSAVSAWQSDSPPLFLGRHGEQSFFCMDLSHLEEETVAGLDRNAVINDLRQVGAMLSARDGSLLAYSRALCHWHAQARHCGRCGEPTRIELAGHQRVCTDSDCDTQVFPRTDPAVIMLVTTIDNQRALLGRQPSWPPGFYSALAGFCEAGESLESSVAREVYEETRIVVTDATYHSSQPWPFPQSLMLGFMARSPGGEPDVGEDELEDARWFDRRELRTALRMREIRLPPPLSIARRLVDAWLDSE